MIRALCVPLGASPFAQINLFFLSIKVTSKNHSAIFRASAFTLQQEQGGCSNVGCPPASGSHQRGACYDVVTTDERAGRRTRLELLRALNLSLQRAIPSTSVSVLQHPSSPCMMMAVKDGSGSFSILYRCTILVCLPLRMSLCELKSQYFLYKLENLPSFGRTRQDHHSLLFTSPWAVCLPTTRVFLPRDSNSFRMTRISTWKSASWQSLAYRNHKTPNRRCNFGLYKFLGSLAITDQCIVATRQCAINGYKSERNGIFR